MNGQKELHSGTDYQQAEVRINQGSSIAEASRKVGVTD
jgi:hypothetical protein